MAESKQNQEHMTIEAFRAKKAASSPTKSTASPSKSPQNSSKPSTVQSSRPASASRESATKRYVSTENLSGRGVPSLDERQEKVKNLREKQAEERRRKNEERRAAFEERRRRKEENEKERWAALKEQASQQQVSKENSSPLKPGSGRKLPNLPPDGSAKQPGSSLGAPNRPSSLPRPLNRPFSANLMKSPTTGVNRSPSPSSNDNLLRGSTPKELLSPTPVPSRVKGNLGGNKSVSAGSLDSSSSANRRASDGSMGQRPMSGSKQKSRPTSQHSSSLTLNKQNSKKTTSQELLIPSAGKLSKAHSTSSLQKVGHIKEKVHKAEPKPKAGVIDEKTAKQALAERRKKAREEAERQAALDKERQEAERLRKEEEERLRAEEEAKEEARMRELAELLRKQDEERLLLAAEEKERKDREEAERIAAEKVRKEEEEKKAREEEERRAKEHEDRRKQEEAARLERKRRVEQIMSRTRQTASPTTTEEINSATLQQEAKENDPGDTKRKVSEILQKVKGTSGIQSTSNSTSTVAFENSLQSGSESTISCHNVEMNGHNGGVRQLFANERQESSHLVTTSRTASGEHRKENIPCLVSEVLSSQISREDFDVEGTNQVPAAIALRDGETAMRLSPETKQDRVEHSSEGVSGYCMGDDDDETLWLRVEATMKTRQQQAVETLENLGVVAEGDNDSDGEEGQLWKVIEGKLQLTEVV